MDNKVDLTNKYIQDIKYFCDHKECKLEFLSSKLKNKHHNRLEKECKIQKNEFIKLALKYKNLFKELGQKYSFIKYEKKNLLKLKRNYKNVLEISTDKTYFNLVIGKNYKKMN